MRSVNMSPFVTRILMALCCCCLLSLRSTHCFVDLFLSSNETRQLLGYESSLFYVYNGELRPNSIAHKLDVSAKKRSVELTWLATNARTFNVLYDLQLEAATPLVAELREINATGLVPSQLSTFRLAFSCNQTDEPSFDVALTFRLTLARASNESLINGDDLLLPSLNFTISYRKQCAAAIDADTSAAVFAAAAAGQRQRHSKAQSSAVQTANFAVAYIIIGTLVAFAALLLSGAALLFVKNKCAKSMRHSAAAAKLNRSSCNKYESLYQQQQQQQQQQRQHQQRQVAALSSSTSAKTAAKLDASQLSSSHANEYKSSTAASTLFLKNNTSVSNNNELRSTNNNSNNNNISYVSTSAAVRAGGVSSKLQRKAAAAAAAAAVSKNGPPLPPDPPPSSSLSLHHNSNPNLLYESLHEPNMAPIADTTTSTAANASSKPLDEFTRSTTVLATTTTTSTSRQAPPPSLQLKSKQRHRHHGASSSSSAANKQHLLNITTNTIQSIANNLTIVANGNMTMNSTSVLHTTAAASKHGGLSSGVEQCVRFERDQIELGSVCMEGMFSRIYEAVLRRKPATGVDGDKNDEDGGGGADGSPSLSSSSAVRVLVKTCTASASRAQADIMLAESCMLRALKHKNVNAVIGVCLMSEESGGGADGNGDEEQAPLAARREAPLVVFGYCEIGNLKTYFQSLRHNMDDSALLGGNGNGHGQLISVSEILFLVLQLLKGVNYLHSKHIIHKDIATRNCWLDANFALKLADYALARDLFPQDYACLADNRNKPVCWLSLESLTSNVYGVKTDIWSCGVAIWECFTLARQPYAGVVDDPFELADWLALSDANRLARPGNCPVELYDMFDKCWHPLSALRPNLKELFYSMHKFYTALNNYV